MFALSINPLLRPAFRLLLLASVEGFTIVDSTKRSSVANLSSSPLRREARFTRIHDVTKHDFKITYLQKFICWPQRRPESMYTASSTPFLPFIRSENKEHPDTPYA